jgi:Tfp pilus assembly protein PilE
VNRNIKGSGLISIVLVAIFAFIVVPLYANHNVRTAIASQIAKMGNFFKKLFK